MKKEIAAIRAANTANRANWEAGETSLTQLSPQERKRRLGFMPGPGEPTLAELEEKSRAALVHYIARAPHLAAAYPTAWDWRNVNGSNYISSIKNQGSCGSCVAFGTAATLEGSMRVISGIPVNGPSGGTLQDLSEAQLFYCSNSGATCNYGWWVSAAVQFAQQTGVIPYDCFPYTPGDQPCNISCPDWQSKVTKVGASHTITSADQMKTWLSTRGPLITTFTVYSDFYAYRSGVYTHQSGGLEGGHCVCCIGYSDTLNAWLCKNSWGTGWGMDGYFWIGYGQCGIDAAMTAIDNFAAIYPLYNDIFVRANLNDVGATPRTGALSSSPDIIPWGPLPYGGDFQAFFKSNYGSDVGQNVFVSEQNYIYVRGRNLSSGAQAGTVSLYWSKASLLMWPSVWRDQALMTEQGRNSANLTAISEGDVVVGSAPFVWTPQPIDGDHYCLISRVVTPQHPNEIPAITTMDQFVSWIANTPAVGWRNVVTVKGDTPTWQVPVNLTVTNGVQLYLQLNCSKLPLGTAVQFACGTEGPNPPLVLQKSVITNYPSQTVGIVSDIPANFNSSVLVSFWLNGKTVTEPCSITFMAYYLVPGQHALAHLGVPLAELGKPAMEGAAALMANPTTAILVGQVVINVQHPAGEKDHFKCSK